eukprot:Rhum_TRINITY_DN19072_c0_g1::Rhum_TRINITY_DN19072_c0_g1_i1::g.169182::m.169182
MEPIKGRQHSQDYEMRERRASGRLQGRPTSQYLRRLLSVSPPLCTACEGQPHCSLLLVDLLLAHLRKSAVARDRRRPLQVPRQPVLLEPHKRVLPAAVERDDRGEAQVLLRRADVKPPVHHHHLHCEGRQLRLRSGQKRVERADVREHEHQRRGEVELLLQVRKAHPPRRLGNGGPEQRVTLLVRVRRAVRAHVELAQRRAVLVQGTLAEDEPVAVVVDVRKADAVLAVAEDAQLARARRLHHVGQKEGVAGAVHLVRRHRHRQKLVAARRRHLKLAHRLRLGVRRQIRLLRQLRHLCLRYSVDVLAVETRAGARGVHELAHTVLAAARNHVLRALVVHLLVQVVRVEGTHGAAIVPHAVCALARRGHLLQVAQVALHVLDLRRRPVLLGRRRDVEGYDVLRTALHKHLDETLANEAAAARHNAPLRHGRVLGACRRDLLRRQEGGKLRGCHLRLDSPKNGNEVQIL